MTGVEEIAYLAYAAAAVSAVSAVSTAQTQSSAADYNAEIEKNKATAVNSAATAQVEQQRTKARAMIGQQLAATSESGTGLSGSNLDMLNLSLTNMERDSSNIRYRANSDSQGLNAKADLDQAQGDAAMTGGYLNAAGSLLKAGSTYTMQGSTMPGTPTGGSGLTYSGMTANAPSSIYSLK